MWVPVSIPGSRRSPGEGNGYPLQYSCLVNSMDRGVWQSHMVFVMLGSQRVGYDWATNILSLHTTLYNTSILSSCFFKHSKKKKDTSSVQCLEVSSTKGRKQALPGAEKIAALSVKCGMWRASDFYCHCARLCCDGMQEGAFKMIILWF